MPQRARSFKPRKATGTVRPATPKGPRLYSKRAWQRLSKAFLHDHPLCECEDCKAAGLLTPSSVVHHKVAHQGDEDRFWDVANLAALSKRCHDRLTARENALGKRGNSG